MKSMIAKYAPRWRMTKGLWLVLSLLLLAGLLASLDANQNGSFDQGDWTLTKAQVKRVLRGDFNKDGLVTRGDITSLFSSERAAAATALWVNVIDAGAKCDGVTNDAGVLQGLLDSVKDSDIGITLFFPKGDCVVTTKLIVPRHRLVGSGNQRDIVFLGAGRDQAVLEGKNLVGPVVTWAPHTIPTDIPNCDSGIYDNCWQHAKTTFLNMTLKNVTSAGRVLDWASRNHERDRLYLTMENVDVEYLGNTNNTNIGYDCNTQRPNHTVTTTEVRAIYLCGSHYPYLSNITFKGGSPSNATAPGWGLYFDEGSEGYLEHLRFVGDNAGRGISFNEGGNFTLVSTHVDGGNRRGGPAYQINGTLSVTVIGMEGIEAGDNPFLLVSNEAHDINIFGLKSTLGPQSDGNADTVMIDGGKGINITGGDLPDKAALSGNGVALRIKGLSDLITIRGLTVAKANTNVVNETGGKIDIEVYDRTNPANPPDDFKYFGSRRAVGTATWNTTIAGNATGATNVAAPGARPGMSCYAGHSGIGANNVLISAFVATNDSAHVVIQNKSGSSLSLSGKVNVQCWGY